MQKDLPELIKAEVISPEIAERINAYYLTKGNNSVNRLFTIFGVLGAILVGLGIILIIAHNWDELSRPTKTFFAFLPLLTGQVLCTYSLIRKNHSETWKESSAAFLFFSVGASISLISQIYHIPGNLSAFLFTWMLLCLPIIYLMNSSLTALLYIAGITYYAAEVSYFSYPKFNDYYYWLLLFAVFPHYYFVYKTKHESNNFVIYNVFVPLSIIIALGTVISKNANVILIGYFSLFALFYLFSQLKLFKDNPNNGFKLLAILGTNFLLLWLSFDFYWKHLYNSNESVQQIISTQEFLISGIIFIIATAFLYLKYKEKEFIFQPYDIIYILFFITFFIGLYTSLSVLLINLILLFLGLYTVWEGAKKEHLGILNYGLLLIAALVTCRFFDSNLSFVLRGIMFLTVGIGFFAANYLMLKKLKENE